MKRNEQYVFISYSSKNQQMADSVRLIFIEKGIPCWMAPYDIPAGSQYAYVINDALENCTCLVLLLTNASQESQFVGREIERAITYRKPIIPMQLEDIQLNSGFKFFIGNCQIIAVPEINSEAPAFNKVLDGIQQYMSFDDHQPQNTDQRIQFKDAVVQNDVSTNNQTYLDKLRADALTGDIEAQYLLAVEYEKSKDEHNAVYWYQKASEQGHSMAQVALGVHLFLGDFESIDVDYTTSKELFEKAAEQGNKYAQFNLGVCYELGKGGDQNIAHAVSWYHKAAEQGVTAAQKTLAVFYYSGENIPQNIVQAVRWFAKADVFISEDDGPDIPLCVLDPLKCKLAIDNPLWRLGGGHLFTDEEAMKCLDAIYSKDDGYGPWLELCLEVDNAELQHLIAKFYIEKSKKSRSILTSKQERKYLEEALLHLLHAIDAGSKEAELTRKLLWADKRIAKIIKDMVDNW